MNTQEVLSDFGGAFCLVESIYRMVERRNDQIESRGFIVCHVPLTDMWFVENSLVNDIHSISETSYVPFSIYIFVGSIHSIDNGNAH